MNDLMNEAIRGAGPAFLKTKGSEDEYFVIVFSDAPSMVVSYTTDAKLMPRMCSHRPAKNRFMTRSTTALDAMKEAANPRQDTCWSSRRLETMAKGQTDDQLVNYAIKQPVQVYSIDMGGGNEPRQYTGFACQVLPEARQACLATVRFLVERSAPNWLRQ